MSTIEYVHVFVCMCYRAAGPVRIAESCGQGQLRYRSEVTQLSPSAEVGMDVGGQERTGDEEAQ